MQKVPKSAMDLALGLLADNVRQVDRQFSHQTFAAADHGVTSATQESGLDLAVTHAGWRL